MLVEQSKKKKKTRTKKNKIVEEEDKKKSFKKIQVIHSDISKNSDDSNSQLIF